MASEKSVDDKMIPMTSVASGKGIAVLSDLYQFTIQIVNIHCIGDQENFVLIDTGMPQKAKALINAIEDKFGKGSKPRAIILTHGHFDHVGSIVTLLEKWDVPVYAHQLEAPYLTGEKAYPPPDAFVEGGLLAKISPVYPNEPIDISDHLHLIKEGEIIPELADFNIIHTPGHSPGHISLFREGDRTLIAGDAFTFVKQDALIDVLLQKQSINGPPNYLTTDWQAAKTSVEKLVALQPNTAVSGHGAPMQGNELRQNLQKLKDHFDDIAKSDYGQFV